MMQPDQKLHLEINDMDPFKVSMTVEPLGSYSHREEDDEWCVLENAFLLKFHLFDQKPFEVIFNHEAWIISDECPVDEIDDMDAIVAIARYECRARGYLPREGGGDFTRE